MSGFGVKDDFGSVHLQDFPSQAEFEFFGESHSGKGGLYAVDVVRQMDFVRSICSAALAIRKRTELKARIPLQSLSVIGSDIDFIVDYEGIVIDEVNVKSLLLERNFQDHATQVLRINYAKCGKRLGSAMQTVAKFAKEGQWSRLSNGSIIVGDEMLRDDEFEIKAVPVAVESDEYEAVGSSTLVRLDTKLTDDLKKEAIARDLVRAVQALRKDLDLDISSRITLSCLTDDAFTRSAIAMFEEYISTQVLAKNGIKIMRDVASLENSTERCSEVAPSITGEGILFGISTA